MRGGHLAEHGHLAGGGGRTEEGAARVGDCGARAIEACGGRGAQPSGEQRLLRVQAREAVNARRWIRGEAAGRAGCFVLREQLACSAGRPPIIAPSSARRAACSSCEVA